MNPERGADLGRPQLVSLLYFYIFFIEGVTKEYFQRISGESHYFIFRLDTLRHFRYDQHKETVHALT